MPDNQIRKIKERVSDDKDSNGRYIEMSRVPGETHDEFKDLAEAKFCNDYGMTLAVLLEYYKLNEYNREHIQDLEQRVSGLEKMLAESDNEDEDGSKEVNTLQ